MADAEHDGLKQAAASRVMETVSGPRTETEDRRGEERLDQALDEALAATFPASDPVARSYR